MPIFIDNRGSGEADLAGLLKGMRLAVEVRHIDSGDIVFGDVGIERKTLNDLANSIYGQNRHFWEQIKVLKDTYKSPFILIEGLIDWKDKFLTGVVFSIIFGWKVPIINTYNLQDSAYAIKSLFIKYGQTRTKSYPPAAVRKADTPKRVRWMMLQCIRGVGPVAAKRIMEALPDIFVACYYPEAFKDGLNEVKGLNKRSKELLMQVFKG